MKLILKGHDLKYETEQIVFLFFPNHEDVTLKSSMIREGNKTQVSTEIMLKDEKAYNTETIFMENPDKKQLGNLVKLSAFKACRQISNQKTPWGILTGIRPAKKVTQMLLEGISEKEIKKTFVNDYLVSEDKFDLALSIAKKELKFLKDNDEKKVSLYIGIPFCPSRCYYCSFISSAINKTDNITHNYIKSLSKEIEKTAEIIKNQGFKIETIYIGGGTPTSLSPSLLQFLLDSIAKNFTLSNLLEFTVEAGRPDTITKEKLKIIKNSPANRISINPQTIHNKTLKSIGRNHSAEDFISAFSLARDMGFDNINSDIIAGLPGEDNTMFEKTLNKVINLKPEGLTVHTLYIKRASYLKNLEIQLAEPDIVSKMIKSAEHMADLHGYSPYYMYRQKSTIGNLENVGFSKPGYECIYNIRSMSDTQTIIAAGAGGVTKIVIKNRIERIFNYKNADDYISGFDEIINRKNKLYDYMR